MWVECLKGRICPKLLVENAKERTAYDKPKQASSYVHPNVNLVCCSKVTHYAITSELSTALVISQHDLVLAGQTVTCLGSHVLFSSIKI